jgi:predicted XRE-type DNA-binding protein
MKLEEYKEIQERLDKLLNESRKEYEELRKNAETLRVKGQLGIAIATLSIAENQLKVSTAILNAKDIVLDVAERFQTVS